MPLIVEITLFLGILMFLGAMVAGLYWLDREIAPAFEDESVTVLQVVPAAGIPPDGIPRKAPVQLVVDDPKLAA
ncbi:MAG: hypothetical protein AAF752_01330 [Bacteroidota bacterium]